MEYNYVAPVSGIVERSHNPNSILNQYAEYLRNNDMMSVEDFNEWQDFLMYKYGIPKNDEGVNYGG